MANPFDPANYRAARELLRELLENQNAIYTGHAIQQMRLRGVTTVDVQEVLNYGQFIEHGPGRKPDEWHYSIVGKPDGISTRCEVVLTESAVMIITVWRE